MSIEECKIYIDKLTSLQWHIISDDSIAIGLSNLKQEDIEIVLRKLVDIDSYFSSSPMNPLFLLVNKEDIISHIRENKINIILKL